MILPCTFDFASSQPGAIVNLGNLTVQSGQNVVILGGTVVGTGTLEAPGGQITVAAVPGQNLLRISQQGHLLSLEISPSSSVPLSPLSLPQLLTGSGANATEVKVNGDNTVQLTGSGVQVESGDVVAQNLTAETATLFAHRNLILVESQLNTASNMTLLAGNTVFIRDSKANPFAAHAGGNLDIQGNENIDILVLHHPQTPFISGGNLSLVSNGLISSDAHYSVGGSFSILNLASNPSNFISLYDPIIFSSGDVTFGNYTGPSLWIEAAGRITAGGITINAIDPAISSEPVLILRAGATIAPGNVTLASGSTQTAAGTTFNSPVGVSPPSINVGNLAVNASGIGGPVILEAVGDITTGSISSNGGTIYLNSSSGAINTSLGILSSTSTNGNSGNIALQAERDIITGGLNSSSINSNGGNITVFSKTGAINTSAGTVNASSVSGNGGDVLLYAAQNSITTGNLTTASTNGNGGKSTFYAGGNINTVNINTSGLIGGEISLTSINGAINTSAGTLNATSTTGNGSPVTLQALGNITTSGIGSNGGNINLTSTTGAIDTSTGTLNSAMNGGAGGTVTLYGVGIITTGGIKTNEGDINLLSSNGGINTSAGNLDTTSAATILIEGLGDLTTGNIISHGGEISLESSEIRGNDGTLIRSGNINTRGGKLDSSSDTGNGGAINILASDDLTTGDIISDGGSISLLSGSDINTGEGTLNSTSDTGPGGEITLGDRVRGRDITTGNITSDGGKINLYSRNGINTSGGTLDSSTDSDTGEGGAIKLEAGNFITTGNIISNGGSIRLGTLGNINTSDGTLDSSTDRGEGGGIELEAGDLITAATGGLITTASITSDGGNISLISLAGIDTRMGTLDSTSDIGNGGEITLLSRTSITTGDIITGDGQVTRLINDSIILPNFLSLAILRYGEPALGFSPPPPPEAPALVALPIINVPTIASINVPTIASLPPNQPIPNNPTSSTSQPSVNPSTLELNQRSREDNFENEQPARLALAAADCIAQEQLPEQTQGLPPQRVLQNYKAAIECYQKNIDLARELGDRPREGYALHNLAVTYYALGNYAKAMEYHQQRLALAQSQQDALGRGQALNGLGAAYGAIGNYDKAIKYYQQSLELARSLPSPELEGATLSNLGLIFYAKKNYTKAVELEQQSLAFAQQHQDRRGKRQALSNLGLAYYALTDYAQAIEYQKQSLTLAKELQDRLGEVRSLENLGLAYYALKDYTKAIEYQHQSLTLARELGDRNAEGRALSNLGDALFQANQPEEAIKTLLAAIDIWESLRSDLGSDDLSKVSLFEVQETTYSTLQEILVKQNQLNTGLEITERGRSRAFVELLMRGLSSSQSVQDIPTPPNSQQIQQIARSQNSTLVSYSIMQRVVETEGVRQLQDWVLYIWVIQPTGKIEFRQVDLTSLDTSLKDLVASSRHSIGVGGRGLAAVPSQDEATQSVGLQQLHQLLIEPIAEFLPKDPKERVIFIPHQSLFLVPFAALRDTSGKYLIEKHTIVTAPSIQVLQLTEQQRRAASGKGLLVVGNPTMPSITTETGELQQLPELPGSQVEAIEIARILNTQPLIGNQATKTSVMPQMLSAGIIHLATHGLLEDFTGQGVPGAIILAPDPPLSSVGKGGTHSLGTCGEIRYPLRWNNSNIPLGQSLRTLPEGLVAL